MSGDPETLASLGRAICVQEGYLIEAIIVALAFTHSDRLVLTGVRLPLLPAALDIIRKNPKSLYEGLSFDAAARSMGTYHPDLIIADRDNRSAVIIDVKRSLSGYLGGSKLGELQQRMTASGLVLPDVLWRDHQRLAVERVGTAIIDASRDSDDTSEGIWSLASLDSLLDIPNAGSLTRESIDGFRDGIRKIWRAAILQSIETAAGSATTSCSAGPGETDVSRPPAVSRSERAAASRAAITEQPRVS